jgi:hypothetical protein
MSYAVFDTRTNPQRIAKDDKGNIHVYGDKAQAEAVAQKLNRFTDGVERHQLAYEVKPV